MEVAQTKKKASIVDELDNSSVSFEGAEGDTTKGLSIDPGVDPKKIMRKAKKRIRPPLHVTVHPDCKKALMKYCDRECMTPSEVVEQMIRMTLMAK